MELLQSILDASAAGIVAFDENDHVVAMNQRLLDLWKLPESAKTERSSQSLQEQCLALIKNPEEILKLGAASRKNPEQPVTFRIELKDGRTIERYSAPRYIRGKFAGSLITFRDITSRSRAEEKLKLSETQFRTFFEFAGIGITLFDLQGNLLRCNPAFCQMMGYSEEELKKIGIAGFSDPSEFEEKNKAFLRELGEGKRDKFELKKNYIRKDGGVRRGHLICSVVRDSQGVPRYGVGMIVDITERENLDRQREFLFRQEQKSNEEARRAVRDRDEFIAVASHELRTPLTPLKMQLQFLEKQLKTGKFSNLPEAESIIKMLGVSQQQLERLNRLIEDMLNASQIAAGTLPIERENFDLSTLVRDVIERYRDELARSGCELIQNLQSNVSGSWDRFRIDQVIVNLITNSMKYGKGKPIEISTSLDGGLARLTVQDHGIGIPHQDHERIFHQYQRGVPINEYGGFGLGLYISRQIVMSHGGSIRVESQAGSGAKFIVQLPVRVS